MVDNIRIFIHEEVNDSKIELSFPEFFSYLRKSVSRNDYDPKFFKENEMVIFTLKYHVSHEKEVLEFAKKHFSPMSYREVYLEHTENNMQSALAKNKVIKTNYRCFHIKPNTYPFGMNHQKIKPELTFELYCVRL